jgi:outer membrane receptor for ferrienterochelin and colicins
MKLMALVLATLSVVAQAPRATLTVEVTANSRPVSGARVTFNGETLKTGSDGVATAPVPLGAVKVVVVKDGYLPSTSALEVNAAREWIVRVELQLAENVEEEITVYATRNDVRIQDSPLRVEVLQQDEIEEKMLMTPGDIVMMLNEMGGMRVQTTSPSLGAASVRMQGMRGRYTRFLSDGLPLFGQQGAGLGLLQIPPMDLGQVEVIKGTASALYGAGAIAGVVNLISRRPAAEPVHEFLVNRTTLGGTDASTFVAAQLSSTWGMSFLGGGYWQGRRDIDHDGWADLPGYSRGITRPRFYWDGGHGGTALLTGGITYENRSGGTVPGAVLSATGSPYRESLETRRYDFGANSQLLIAGRYVMAARFSTSTQRHNHQFGEVLERDRHELLFGEVSLRGSEGRHTWIAGLAAERDAYRPRDVRRFAYTYVTPGVFLQDDLNLAPWFSISASARADFQSEFGTFVSPRISGLFRWAGWTSRVSAGQGFFAPTPLTEETEAAGLSRLSVPVPLKPERGRSASIDLTRELGPVSLTTTLFASTIRHPVHVNRGDRYEIVNLREPTTNRGAEILGTWRKKPFAATVSYTYVRSRELELTGGRSDVPLTPRHSFGLVGVWKREDKARLGVECYYTGRQRLEYDPFRRFSEPYVIFGLMGERKVNAHVKLFLNLENLTNVRQTRWDSLLRPSRGPDGRWTVDAWAPLDGRVINGGARFAF